ncbi:MAG: hypothetical protein J6M53_05415 [Bacteroidaceae bacterium]|nr:hypothetical protein [Bacteroidaceae bacterium]
MTSTDIKTIELIVNSEQAKKKLDELNARLVTMKQKREVFWRKVSAKETCLLCRAAAQKSVKKP